MKNTCILWSHRSKLASLWTIKILILIPSLHNQILSKGGDLLLRMPKTLATYGDITLFMVIPIHIKVISFLLMFSACVHNLVILWVHDQG
mgnify:CR=1 FL=1